MGTQVKLQAISSLLSNEHLQKIETNKPHTETWIYSQPHASNIVLSRFTGNPRIPVPVGHRCQWRHNHDGQGPLMSSIYSAVFCVIGTDGQNSSQVQWFQDCCGLLPFVHMINDLESSQSLIGFKFWDRAQTHHHLGVPLISGVRALGPVKIRWQWHVFGLGKSNSMQ